MENSKRKALIALVLVLVFGFWIIKSLFFSKAALVTVVGEGKVTVAPTMVKFTVAVSNLAPNATEAINNNKKIVNDLIGILKVNGVSENDISLSYVRVIPPTTTLGQTSYQAVNSVDATLKNISQFDKLVLQIYGLGANSVSNIVFTTENSKEVEKQAVNLAIKEAKQRAKELAEASGKRLGRMVSLKTVEVGEAGALSGQTSKDFVSNVASPSKIEVLRQASIVYELR